MNTAICCIGKCENLYIRDYVEYYKKLGFSHIYLYDNNDIDGERFEDVIWDYICNGYVTLLGVRGQRGVQLGTYQHCYDEFGSLYDWMMFIDSGDEYLTLPNHASIQDFLSEQYFEPYQIIHINLMTFGDCDKVYYEKAPVYERFQTPILPLEFCHHYDFPENMHVSSIVRGGLTGVIWVGWSIKNNPHTPGPERGFACCNASGEPIEDSSSPFNTIDFTNAYFKHFTTKTIEEYVIKVNRRYPDISDSAAAARLTKDWFFRFNRATEEKSKVFDKVMMKCTIEQLNKVGVLPGIYKNKEGEV